MKMVDIKVGQEYAVKALGQVLRGRVVATDHEYQAQVDTWGRGSWTRGVSLHWLDPETGEVLMRSVFDEAPTPVSLAVQPQQVRMLWSDYLPTYRLVEADKKLQKRRREEGWDATRWLRQRFGVSMNYGESRDWWKMSNSDLIKLVNELKELEEDQN